MKTGKGGLVQREALLDSHKHRKQSRKRVSECYADHTTTPNKTVLLELASQELRSVGHC